MPQNIKPPLSTAQQTLYALDGHTPSSQRPDQAPSFARQRTPELPTKPRKSLVDFGRRVFGYLKAHNNYHVSREAAARLVKTQQRADKLEQRRNALIESSRELRGVPTSRGGFVRTTPVIAAQRVIQSAQNPQADKQLRLASRDTNLLEWNDAISKNASLTSQDATTGDTALHTFAANANGAHAAHAEMAVEAVFRTDNFGHVASFETLNNLGESPLTVAVSHGNMDLAHLILQASADSGRPLDLFNLDRHGRNLLDSVSQKDKQNLLIAVMQHCDQTGQNKEAVLDILDPTRAHRRAPDPRLNDPRFRNASPVDPISSGQPSASSHRSAFTQVSPTRFDSTGDDQTDGFLRRQPSPASSTSSSSKYKAPLAPHLSFPGRDTLNRRPHISELPPQSSNGFGPTNASPPPRFTSRMEVLPSTLTDHDHMRSPIASPVFSRTSVNSQDMAWHRTPQQPDPRLAGDTQPEATSSRARQAVTVSPFDGHPYFGYSEQPTRSSESSFRPVAERRSSVEDAEVETILESPTSSRSQIYQPESRRALFSGSVEPRFSQKSSASSEIVPGSALFTRQTASRQNSFSSEAPETSIRNDAASSVPSRRTSPRHEEPESLNGLARIIQSHRRPNGFDLLLKGENPDHTRDVARSSPTHDGVRLAAPPTTLLGVIERPRSGPLGPTIRKASSGNETLDVTVTESYGTLQEIPPEILPPLVPIGKALVRNESLLFDDMLYVDHAQFHPSEIVTIRPVSSKGPGPAPLSPLDSTRFGQSPAPYHGGRRDSETLTF